MGPNFRWKSGHWVHQDPSPWGKNELSYSSENRERSAGHRDTDSADGARGRGSIDRTERDRPRGNGKERQAESDLAA